MANLTLLGSRVLLLVLIKVGFRIFVRNVKRGLQRFARQLNISDFYLFRTGKHLWILFVEGLDFIFRNVRQLGELSHVQSQAANNTLLLFQLGPGRQFIAQCKVTALKRDQQLLTQHIGTH